MGCDRARRGRGLTTGEWGGRTELERGAIDEIRKVLEEEFKKG